MRPIFRTELVNPPFGDPGLYVDFLYEKRALLFDLGENRSLPSRKLLRVTHVFVTHTHMDHFFGFDWLLRISLGRPNTVRLYGPPGILDQVLAKVSAYTWNLVENYDSDFTLEVGEVHPDGRVERARHACRRCFAREPLPPAQAIAGVICSEANFRVRAVFLDHSVPVLGYALEESAHINVWKTRIRELGLEVGPWLRTLKQAVLDGAPDDTPIVASWQSGGEPVERRLRLRELREALEVVPGSRIAYITDVVHHEQNAQRIAALARDADQLYIESVFLQEDADHAARKFHLTAHQAGTIARAAGARQVIPFHFSPRYGHREAELRAELERARRGS